MTQLFAVFGPIAVQIYRQHQAAHNGDPMTDAQLVAEFTNHIKTYLK
jgi:hypothetical protein